MRSQAKIVVIGGGVMGCSLAYHLCKEGWTDLVLLEKAELTSGSTWHAAGQVSHSVSHLGLAHMNKYATELYPQLEAETEQSCTWHGSGSLRMAYSRDEVDWLHYTVSVGRNLGLNLEVIGHDEIAKLHPFYNLDGIQAALYTPDDGHVDPAGVAFAMAKGARMMGAEVVRHNRVSGIDKQANGEWRVHTEQGDIDCEILVNAGGTYARQIGQWLGLDLPIANMLHHYLITEPVPEFQNLQRELPVVRDDREVSGYIRMEQKSALIGIYEKANAATVWDQGTPWEAEHELFDPDYDRIAPWLENAMQRMPILQTLGIKRVVHGAITHPPDGNMLLGPVHGLNNFWLCCGSQIGIAWGPGAGKYLAQWIVHGAADISMRPFDPRRFGPWIDDHRRIEKAREDYLLRHETPYPHQDRPACRPAKTSPLYDVLKTKGAVYEEVFGWERPYWYAINGMAREHIHSFRRSDLHDIVAKECIALRNKVGIADLTAFGKIEVRGPDAYAFLQRMCANRIASRRGGITLTHLLIDNGRIEGEATVIQITEDCYYLVFAAVRELAMQDWLEKHVLETEDLQIVNVSQDYGVIMLAGPSARKVLSQVTHAPLDNAAFPWLCSRDIEISGASLRALRVTYTGELGWELHVPMLHMLEVYNALVWAGEPHGLVHVGSATLNSLRMEKAYRSGHELTSEVTMSEAQVQRFARLDKDYLGVETNRLESQHQPQRWQLVLLEIDDASENETQADPIGSESLWSENQLAGAICSGGYGHCVQKGLAYAYLKPDFTTSGTELEALILGQCRSVRVIPDEALWDPQNLRPRSED